MDESSFVLLYKSMVRPHLEYANSVWWPYKQGDIKELEKNPKKSYQTGNKLKKKIPYKDRLMHLKLPTLKYRRLHGDMIEVFKITCNLYDPEVSPELRYYPKSNTRGNKYKLHNHAFHYDTWKYSFTARIVNIWNSLPNSVVDGDTVCLFEARLDKFWMHQDVLYNFTADLTGIGDRSVRESSWL